jgi:photosystem II stability/assembly factor-like uncharacterized protein
MKKSLLLIVSLFVIIFSYGQPKNSILLVDKLPPVSKMQFLEEKIGYCISEFKEDAESNTSLHLLKTMDGGIHWNKLPTPFISVNTFYFLNANLGWVSAVLYNKDGSTFYGLCYTKDGGNKWFLIWKSFAEDIFFINEQKGWAVASDNFIIHTEDGV